MIVVTIIDANTKLITMLAFAEEISAIRKLPLAVLKSNSTDHLSRYSGYIIFADDCDRC